MCALDAVDCVAVLPFAASRRDALPRALRPAPPQKDTCQLTCLSLNLARKHHPKIWGATQLPAGALRAVLCVQGCCTAVVAQAAHRSVQTTCSPRLAACLPPPLCLPDAWRLSAAPCGGVLVLSQHLVLYYRQVGGWVLAG